MIPAHDMYAGAGGSSDGMRQTGKITIVGAGNHWPLAIEVHNANHPDTDHICADLSQIHPRMFKPAVFAWFSPECTNHTIAKGKKQQDRQPDLFGEVLPDEAAERSRATMWDVVRFSEYHRYRALVVENVVDAYQWVPFQAWLMAMASLGYDHQIVYLNSMHAQHGGLPAPQSRDRMYVVFWLRGERRPDLQRIQRPAAWCPSCDEVVEPLQTWKKPDRPWGRYRAQYYYRCPKHSCRGQRVEPGWLPAVTAIDWTIPGTRIGDRPLKEFFADKAKTQSLGWHHIAPKTRARIAAGIARYWGPFSAEVAGHTYDAADPRHPAYGRPDGYYRAWPTSEVLKTLHTIDSKALLVPVEGRDGKEARSADAAMRTMTTRNETGVLMPFIAELRGGGSDARPAAEPLATVTASGNHHGLVVPAGGTWNDDARSTDEALRTLATRDAYAMVTAYYGTSTAAQPAGDPLGTVTTRDRHALIMRNDTGKSEPTVITPGDLEAADRRVDDCLFRMFEPHEIAAGMAFPATYRWRGTRRERVRLAGNAVTPPVSRDLGSVVVEDVFGEAA
ncbi:DNA cytosine methyltransferase [Microlunatus sp. GCM10028923]|uniref:DNA cytosine methyltransferase n=1 Tax=Microlunatus sp. GCM10028923 TaxID=3273400 RepID=UPI003608D795